MDWQGDGLDVALEYDPATRRMRYPVVVWIVPRRAGKTHAAGLVNLTARATSGPRRRCWYTAHKREVAAALWRDEWFPMLETSRFSRATILRKSNGSETITHKDPRWRGSTVRLFAPSGDALRSQNADAVVVDEAREFTVDAGEALEAAVRPAQARRPGRQLWIVSNAGTVLSTYLARYRDAGRAGDVPGLCYLEHSAPQDLDPMDPETWRIAHPAVASGDVPVEALAADASTMTLETFTTEYLGWWHEGRPEPVVDPAAWIGCADPAATSTSPFVFVVDVAADRSHTAIARAGTGPDGRPVVEVVDYRPGVRWAAPVLAELRRAHRGSRITGDSLAAAPVLADLARARVPYDETGGTDLARACASFLDDVNDRRLIHRAQPVLDDAVAGGARRTIGDGWAWSRLRADVDISPLVAVTLAAWAHRTRPAAGKPAIAASGR